MRRNWEEEMEEKLIWIYCLRGEFIVNKSGKRFESTINLVHSEL